MSRNPLTAFQRAAEAAGYPALLFVTIACLVIIVDAIVLLAVMQSGWAFAWSMLSLIVALALLWGGFDAALADDGDDADDAGATPTPAAVERGEVVALPECGHANSREHERRAA
jgi:hypothetical protein